MHVNPLHLPPREVALRYQVEANQCEGRGDRFRVRSDVLGSVCVDHQLVDKLAVTQRESVAADSVIQFSAGRGSMELVVETGSR